MTVIAWDGRFIAADRMAVVNEVGMRVTKLVPFNDLVLGVTGTLNVGKEMCDWYMEGAAQEKYPKSQYGESYWSRLIVSSATGVKVIENKSHVEFTYAQDQRYAAWGSGSDFALGALAMGANAGVAVRLANEHCPSCGMGIDIFDLQPPNPHGGVNVLRSRITHHFPPEKITYEQLQQRVR